VKFKEIVNRINGVSCPIFGVSWNPGQADVEVARQAIAFVEVRRVLFAGYAGEVPDQCVQSVVEIRDFLTDLIGQGRIADELANPLRVMRRYCVGFLTRVGRNERAGNSDRYLFSQPAYRMMDYFFGEALGELRAGVGMQVAIIAASFGLDVEDDLAQTLPAPFPGRS
jgi:hypothetical protein